MECLLVDMFHWPLCQIDDTDIESLIPFVFHYPRWKGRRGGSGEVTQKVYADQAEL